jgi:thermostable 8-oxoguanine DNA glycosylase
MKQSITITPERVTKFDRTDEELESFLIFAIAVAGKKASSIAPKVTRMVEEMNGTPFTYLRSSRRDIDAIMHHYRMGPYDQRMIPAINGILDLDLRSCTLHDLLAIKGIGPKTARFFLLHSRPDQELIVLDVHILRYLKQRFHMKVPKSTPSGKRYLAIEAEAIRKIKKYMPNWKSFAEFDLNAWMLMRSKGEKRKPKKKKSK